MCSDLLTVRRMVNPFATEEDFLRRAELEGNRKKAMRKRVRSRALSTDTLYSRLVEQKAQVEAQYQEEASPYRNLSPYVASPYQNPSPHKTSTRQSALSSYQTTSPQENQPKAPSSSKHFYLSSTAGAMSTEKIVSTFPKRKIKFEMTIEDFLKLSAPYSRTINNQRIMERRLEFHADDEPQGKK
ncbi:hypothetical protein CDL15_Pgr023504 [Punica granatum]|nr:hypothetical protein CDL15_Pgr023504 [Punica granatum]